MKDKALPIWFAAGFASVPVAVLLHELGHYTTSRLLGWRDLAFHYSRVNLASGGPIAASAIHAPWKVALVYIGGWPRLNSEKRFAGAPSLRVLQGWGLSPFPISIF